MTNSINILRFCQCLLPGILSFLNAFSYTVDFPAFAKSPSSFLNAYRISQPDFSSQIPSDYSSLGKSKEAAFFVASDTTYTTICNNQLPYQWNGNTYISAGNYSVILTGSNGGDSVAVLSLSVINVNSSITNAVICTNQLPYTWNGNSYTTSGTYSVTLTSSSGCDSVPILSLTVNDVVTSLTARTVCNNQLPYTWNGNQYLSAGIYADTLTSAAGCDSIATLNLTVKLVKISTTNISICNDQLPYYWNGNMYPAAGNYSVTLPGSNGCDSVATLNLSANASVTSNTLVSVCASQLPYSWNGNTYIAAGNYSVNLISVSGCDSVAALQLSVTNALTSTTYTTICLGQLPYSWNGNTYTGAGIYSVTLTNSSGCDSIARLRLTVIPFLSSTTTRIICVSQLPYSWNGNVFTLPGTYTASFVTSAGCDSIATLNLYVNNPVVNSATIRICDNQLPFSWHGQVYTAAGTYGINPPVITGACNSVDTLILIVQPIVPSSTSVTVCSNRIPYAWNGNSYPSGGSYAVNLISSSGCDSTANLHLNVIPVATSTTNMSVCSNDLPYNWNNNDYNSSGIYTAVLRAANGCDSLATLNLEVIPPITSTTDIRICGADIPFSWNGNSYTSGGSYSVTLTASGGCDSLAILRLFVDILLYSTTNITVCNDQLPYAWNGNIYSTPGLYAITLPSIAGCDSVATLNLQVNQLITSVTNLAVCEHQLPFIWNGNSYTASGNYAVNLITIGGCDSIATLNLVINPTATSTTDVSICNNQLPYAWNGNFYPVAGTYPVTLTGSTGCDSIATLNLIVSDILTSTTNATVCSGLLPFQWNGNYYSAGGTYSVTLTLPNGCDSVPILSLTVVPYVTGTANIRICNNQLPYTWNNNSYPAAGIYSVMLTSAGGCDSLATLILTVGPALTSVSDSAVCTNRLPFSWNGNNYTAAGTYSVLLTSVSGCDSIATLNLFVEAVSTSTTEVHICTAQLPYSWNGNNYPAAGIYSVVLTGASGCDSIATLNLVAHGVVTSTTNLAICNSQLPYSWNGNTYASAGTYTVTLNASTGCDSVATLILVANSTVASTTNVSICNDQLPYVWNGNNYPVAGTYTVTLTSSAGCDSIATLILVSNATLSSLTAITICDNQLPYTWNGTNYSSTGTYTALLTSSIGCDSVATLNLQINAVHNSNTSIAVCDNELPYQWNGNSYATAGVYIKTLTGTAGCDSIATLNLVINPVRTSTTNIILCSSQVPFSWNGNVYTVTGTYSAVLSGSSGCDSTATLNLTVQQVTSSITNMVICSDQLPYPWNGEIITSAGSYLVTLINAAGCDSIASLNLSVNPIVTSITNASVCNNYLPYQWNGQSYTTAGLHTITLVSSSGCDSLATLNLTINPVETSMTNGSTCVNELPYYWNGQNYNSAGTYSTVLTSLAGCDSIATLQLIVNPVVSSITNRSICSAALPYVWNGQSFTMAGAHLVILTSTAGCDSIATLNLTINPTPALPGTAPVIYCQYDVTSPLAATITTPGSHLVWYTFATGGTGSLIAPVPSSVISGNTNYYVSQVYGPCEGSRALITVTVNPRPQLGKDSSLKICYGSSADLEAAFNTTGFSGIWSFNQQPVTNPFSVTAEGNYRLVVRNNFGCSDTVIISLSVQPPIIANAGIDDNAEYNAPYQLSGSGGGYYEWLPAVSLNNPSVFNPVAILDHDETFVLTVSDDIGCKDSDTVKIRVLKGPALYVPTAFTPNGDGLNDIFRPVSVGITNLSFFRVFNRYGQLVFETQKLDLGWNGLFKGIPQATGNYVWAIRGTDRTGRIRDMKGNVVLIR